MIHFKEANIADCELINRLAHQVWEPTYGAILSKEQLDYMFEMMYSPESIRQQIEEKGHVYFICMVENNPVGYFSIEAQDGQDGQKYHLHKIYVIPSMQTKGIGYFMLQKAAKYATEKSNADSVTLQLHVNRYNKKALEFYLRAGFTQIGEADFDIGNNYLMNDYILCLELNNNQD